MARELERLAPRFRQFELIEKVSGIAEQREPKPKPARPTRGAPGSQARSHAPETRQAVNRGAFGFPPRDLLKSTKGHAMTDATLALLHNAKVPLNCNNPYYILVW